MIEETEKSGDGKVRINKAAASRQNIREIASDIAPGELVLGKGERIGPAEIGLLATVGAVHASVVKSPMVGIMSTGDELAEASAEGPLPPGTIRDSNRAMLLAACAAEGAQARDLGIISDDASRLEAALDAAMDAGVDVIITSGGVSMGDRDLVKPLLEKRGTIHFGRVLMKPGKPLTFATIPHSSGRTVLVFGLPGNPVSSLVTFHLVVVPVLRKLAGFKDPSLRSVRVRTTVPMRLDPQRPEYHRATISWDDASSSFLALSTGGQRSSRLMSMRSANVLLHLPQASGTLPAGTQVNGLLIGELSSADHVFSSLSLPTPPASSEPGAAPSFTYAGAAALPKVGVLTVSDRASKGLYEDLSGPIIVEVMKEYLATECDFVCRMVPDEAPLIAAAIKDFAASGCAMVCTTGGTGPALRDVTPEAMAQVCEKMFDGFGEQMRRASLDVGVPTAILSRQTAGSVGRCLVLNLPGKPGSIRTCLDAVFPAIPYCIDLLGGPFLEGNPSKVAVFRPPVKK